MIEQVLIKKTLKAGNTVWLEGSIENSPLPDTLIEEVDKKTGTVEVLKGSNKEKPSKLVFAAKKVVPPPAVGTTSTVVKTGPPKISKPKPKLKRRK